jgi:hypothetical protein
VAKKVLQPTTDAAQPKGAASEATFVSITPPNFVRQVYRLIGTAPLVVCKFSAKSREQIKAKQEQGSQAKAGGTKRAPKDFDAVYEQAKHISTEGWEGIHAGAFRSAMIDACRLVTVKMTFAKMGIFVEPPDGFDADEGVPLVRIIGKSKRFEAMGRSGDIPDIRIRPMYFPWEMNLRLKFDSDMFSATSIANLLARAGQQVGIGEGRPYSKNSAGQGWGTFEIG